MAYSPSKVRKNRKAKTEKEGYKRVERTYGSFYRRFSLPDTANAEAISAASKHGVLEVIIPKREAVQPKKISCNSGRVTHSTHSTSFID
jgi:HSP20 family protein